MNGIRRLLGQTASAEGHLNQLSSAAEAAFYSPHKANRVYFTDSQIEDALMGRVNVSTVVTLLLTAMIARGLQGSAFAQSVANGGFEQPVIPSKGYSVFQQGDSTVTAWTIDTASVLIAHADYSEDTLTFNSHGGHNSLDLSGEGLKPGSIFTDITTVNNQAYRLRFWVGNATTNGIYNIYYQSYPVVTVYLDGLLIGRFENRDVVQNSINWKCFSVTVRGTGNIRRLRFAHENINENFAGLDDVSIVNTASGVATTYQYDALGRLTNFAASTPDGIGYNSTYTFDHASNRSNVKVLSQSC